MGRHAIAMATGSWRNKFMEVMETQTTELLPLTFELNHEQRRDLMRDFVSGRNNLLLSMDRKFSQWERLPHALAGCAHDDPVVAQRAAVKCIALYSDLVESDPAYSHPAVSELLSAKSPAATTFKSFAHAQVPDIAQ
eukprot:879625-Amphidinium_carterae.1